MPSSHAANHMGLATFLFLLFRNPFRWLLPFWALLVGYSQVYVGVHFPMDVGLGWSLGAVLGTLVMALFSRAVNGALPGTEKWNFRMRRINIASLLKK
jgi:undecaprenyl-diphosphatase